MNTEKKRTEVFEVWSISTTKTHLGTMEKTLLCGSKLYNPELTKIRVQFDIENKEIVSIHPADAVQKEYKTIEIDTDFCKKCLTILKKNEK